MTRDTAGTAYRREGPALLAGGGRYTADVPLAAPLHVAFLRSPVPGGGVTLCDTRAAAEMPGVVAIVTADDLNELGELEVATPVPARSLPRFEALAGARVHGLGQPVAAVLAETVEQAHDAVEVIELDIDSETDESDPVVAEQTWQTQGCAEAFAGATQVVEAEVRHPRIAPTPMEPRAIAVDYNDDDSVTVWQSTQTPHRSRSELVRILGVTPERLRVIAPDVGGAFGMKASLYPEDVVVVWAAFHTRRSVRWTATRGEEFLSATHGRGAISRGRLALDAQGRFLAVEAQIDNPVGPWLPTSALVPAWNAGRMVPSGYDIPEVSIHSRAIAAPTAPVGIYRGAGRPEAIALVERLIEVAGRATGHDPTELRRRNLRPPEALPCTTATGCVLDSGRYAETLDRLAQAVDYAGMRAECDARRARGEIVGTAMTFYVEPSGSGWESARVTLNADGSVVVASGSSSQGHSRATAYAQIAADALDVDTEMVEVRIGDTATCPAGIGALASRSTAIGGSAVAEACAAARARRQAGAALPVTEECIYTVDGEAWGYGAWVVMLSVDPDTGTPTIERAACIDDIGTVVDPTMVEGQIRGGYAQAVGEALMERVAYDDQGQLVTGSFMDYAMPRAADMSPLDILDHPAPTPSPFNALGAKGVGEAAPIGAPPAILGAAADALAPLGVSDLQMPLTSETLWRAIRDASERSAE